MALSKPFSLFSLVLLCLSHRSNASLANGGSVRFSEWYPDSAHEFADISTGVCNASLEAFRAAYANTPDRAIVNLGLPRPWPVYDLCKAHASCILEHTSELQKASLSTAGVVLGLLPTLLAVLSPSLSELVLLSSQRPFLATFLSVGAPGVLQRRIFEYEDPFELIEASDTAKLTTRSLMILGPWRGWKSMTVALLQYLLAFACAVNTVSLAIQTSNRSILSWGCTRTWPLILWACVPTVIHWTAAVGYRLTLDQSCAIAVPEKHCLSRKGSAALSGDSDVGIGTTTPKTLAHVSSMCVSRDCDHDHTPKPFFQNFADWTIREATSCASHSPALTLRHPLEENTARVRIGICLNCLASFLSFFHVLYGTIVFSALLFITNLDAVGQVITRCLASAVICRFLVLIEMGGMRGAVRAANKQA